MGVLVCLLCVPFLEIYTRWSVQVINYESLKISPYKFFLRASLSSGGNLLLCLALISALFYYCCSTNIVKSVYGAACAYMTQDLAYTVFVLIMPDAAHRGPGAFKPESLWLELLIMAIFYSFFYYFFAKKLPQDGDYRFNCSYSLPFIISILLIGKIMGTYARMGYDLENNFLFHIILIYDVLLSATILILQMLLRQDEIYKTNAAMEKQLRELQYRQYHIFHENIETINHKCHDLKHMIGALRSEADSPKRNELLQELEQAVMIYDSHMNTGNEALNALLANAWLTCEHKQIQWTCLADGNAINFMDSFDLYILLGNALDNAVESVSGLAELEHRFLSVNIWKKKELCFIKIENYCRENLHFVNGLPVTTKRNKREHGFGGESIRSVVERYHGEFHMAAEDHIFTLDIMFPIPSGD